ncbi:hypothetical protein [Membranihabitans maritimus]|uniref:hypothetical protein n=1 Tax=Membranihabitans maritimus TaxID=2904244 RepID=UPI001F25DB6D|nr:hypothetical protein [Membranihabitans maritimus]
MDNNELLEKIKDLEKLIITHSAKKVLPLEETVWLTLMSSFLLHKLDISKI